MYWLSIKPAIVQVNHSLFCILFTSKLKQIYMYVNVLKIALIFCSNIKGEKAAIKNLK